jgi:uncharacterized protein YecE (DUF72 family)
MAGRLHLGTSGYVYGHWRRVFYPERLAVRHWLPFYAARFSTVELNSPFYRLPSRAAFAAWQAAVPDGFVFAVKASRFLTHVRRLRAPAAPVRRLLGRARALDDALGPVLFQLPERFHADVGRLDRLLGALARQRLVPDPRAVLEVRHPSWLVPAVVDRLRAAGVALCLADWRALPVDGPLTADFVYVRRHGPGPRYGDAYPLHRLRRDAADIRRWLGEGRDVYVYFNNDAEGHAVRDARRLHRLLRRGDTAM